jgi:hypothetical protein
MSSLLGVVGMWSRDLGGKIPRRGNVKSGSHSGLRLTPDPGRRTPRVRKSSRPRVRGSQDPGAKRRGGKEPPGGGSRYREGKPAEGDKPMDATGMKQGWKGGSGTKRQEVEKTWRRN